MKIKYLFASILLATGFQLGMAQSALRQQFVNASVKEARPWTFWYWMFGAVTPEGITADLEAMNRVGLGGAYLMPVNGEGQEPQYEGKVRQFTSEWWQRVTHSMKEADRLGMQLGMHISDGSSLAGGTWIAPEESMQKVVWSDTIVNGGNIRNLTLPMPQASDGYYEDIVTYAIPLDRQPEENLLKPEDMISLPLYQGRLTARLPEGKWRILRMGHTATGHVNATGNGGKILECDKFSTPAVRKQFSNWFAEMFKKTDEALARRVLKYMYVGSWECGNQNWSDNFAVEFKKRRGYDLMPYFPLLAGIPMESAARSEQILRDVRTTIGELVTDVFYTVLADCARQYDCRFSARCVAPAMTGDGLMHYRIVDLPMGEFRLNSPAHDSLNDMLDAISGAHIYGKNIIQAEGFAEMCGILWDEDPAMLKPLLDRNYALGINKLFFHAYVHNPWMNRRPGMTLDSIGLFFQRDQTWWEEGKSFVNYITRCQTLLQYGRPVVDIAVFTGEEVPRRSILPEWLVPMLPSVCGAEQLESERNRLADKGHFTRVRPVGATHLANMTDPEAWVNPMRGYAYDSFNKDALLRLAKAEGGRMVLPGGASYKVLVLPATRSMDSDNLLLSPEVQAKVEELRAAGVIIPPLPYREDDFSAFGVERDVLLPSRMVYTHRSGEEYEIYFVANQVDSLRTFKASFRVAGRTPELWNAVTGTITRPAQWKEVDGCTEIALSLPANGSVFVVFPKAHSEVSPELTEKEPVSISVKEWTVAFSSIRKTVTRPLLFDWSKEEDEKIRYYSGHATYRGLFSWKNEQDGKIMLRLGKVANVATVRVNSIACGTVWTAPYEVDITDALRNGVNVLEVEVVNTWANALRGAALDKAPFGGIWTNAKFQLPGDELLPAGWLGPYVFFKAK